MVGEGGNLGFTRRARVEFSQRGGRINADFIDNSAGVDCSDHEVNLKILLGLAERRGEMTRAERDELLEAVTDDVVAHVLYDSFLQAQIIGQEVERSAARLYAYEDLMALLEEQGLLDRASEDLPDAEEIAERRRVGRGMERPELAVLVAYAKRWVARALERTDFVDDPWLERDLRGYFPPAVIERCGHLLAEHPLRRQLLCMTSANSVVNALGPTFVSQLVAERGADPAAVVRAYRIARAVTGRGGALGLGRAPQRRRAQRAGRADGGHRPAGGGDHALVPRLAARAPAWTTRSPRGREGFERLAAALGELGTDERRARRAEHAERLVARGVPEPVAAADALREDLLHAPDMIAVAEATGRSLEEVAQVFFAVGAELRLDWLEGELVRVRAVTRMQRWALQAVREDAFQARRELAQTALVEAEGAAPGGGGRGLRRLAGRGRRRFAGLLRALSREGEPDLAGLTLAVRQLRTIVE